MLNPTPEPQSLSSCVASGLFWPRSCPHPRRVRPTPAPHPWLRRQVQDGSGIQLSGACLHSMGEGFSGLQTPNLSSDPLSYRAGPTQGQGRIPLLAGLLPSLLSRSLPRRVRWGVASLALDQTGFLRIPRTACGICSWDPEPPRARGSPLPPFPASSGPREEGPPWAWGWVLGGKERPAAASALPALLCQPGGDLLGGPESFEVFVRVNLLLPGPHLGVCSLRLLGSRPSLTKSQPSCTRTFSPPLPTPPLPPSAPRVCVCGFIYLPAPRMGAGAPRLPAKGAGRWLGRWLRAPGSGRLPPHARTKASRAWACNLEMG